MKELEKKRYDNKDIWNNLNASQHNKERIEQLAQMVPLNISSLADIGCGNGLFLNYLQKEGKIKGLVGIDFSEVALKEVLVPKKVGDITDIPLQDKSYDIVCAQEVLEHLNLDDFKKAKEELSRVSSKYILISVPFEEDLELEFVKCPLCKTRYNTSHHKRSFTKSDIQQLFEKEGLECSDIKYISKRNEYFLLSCLLNNYRKLKGVRKHVGATCPVCGYGKVLKENRDNSKSDGKKSFFSFLKEVWPKKYKYKWIAAIYIKNN